MPERKIHSAFVHVPDVIQCEAAPIETGAEFGKTGGEVFQHRVETSPPVFLWLFRIISFFPLRLQAVSNSLSFARAF